MDDNQIPLNEVTSAPESRASKLLFFLLGNASLLSFNITINAIDIYLILTKDSDIGAQFSRFYQVPSALTALVLCIWKPSKLVIPLTVALSITFLTLCLFPVFLLAPVSSDSVYWGTLSLISLTAICGATIMSSSFSGSSSFSPRHAALVSSGNGCCGVIASILRIITKAAFSGSSQLKISSSVYFFIAALIIGGTLIFFIWIYKKDSDISHGLTLTKSHEVKRDLFVTMRVIWPLWLANSINFMITLSIFPGYLSSIPQNTPWCSWTPVIVTSLFCVFDWVGRWAPSRFMFPSEKWSWLPVYFRLLFLIVFVISIQNVINLGEPYWTFSWMIPFALTNGYIGTLTVVQATTNGRLSAVEQATAGFLMNFSIQSGILIASGLTFAMPATALPPGNCPTDS
jgi:equilibrative nucleoside transporter 1/2/3